MMDVAADAWSPFRKQVLLSTYMSERSPRRVSFSPPAAATLSSPAPRGFPLSGTSLDHSTSMRPRGASPATSGPLAVPLPGGSGATTLAALSAPLPDPARGLSPPHPYDPHLFADPAHGRSIDERVLISSLRAELAVMSDANAAIARQIAHDLNTAHSPYRSAASTLHASHGDTFGSHAAQSLRVNEMQSSHRQEERGLGGIEIGPLTPPSASKGRIAESQFAALLQAQRGPPQSQSYGAHDIDLSRFGTPPRSVPRADVAVGAAPPAGLATGVGRISTGRGSPRGPLAAPSTVALTQALREAAHPDSLTSVGVSAADLVAMVKAMREGVGGSPLSRCCGQGGADAGTMPRRSDVEREVFGYRGARGGAVDGGVGERGASVLEGQPEAEAALARLRRATGLGYGSILDDTIATALANRNSTVWGRGGQGAAITRGATALASAVPHEDNELRSTTTPFGRSLSRARSEPVEDRAAARSAAAADYEDRVPVSTRMRPSASPPRTLRDPEIIARAKQLESHAAAAAAALAQQEAAEADHARGEAVSQGHSASGLGRWGVEGLGGLSAGALLAALATQAVADRDAVPPLVARAYNTQRSSAIGAMGDTAGGGVRVRSALSGGCDPYTQINAGTAIPSVGGGVSAFHADPLAAAMASVGSLMGGVSTAANLRGLGRGLADSLNAAARGEAVAAGTGASDEVTALEEVEALLQRAGARGTDGVTVGELEAAAARLTTASANAVASSRSRAPTSLRTPQDREFERRRAVALAAANLAVDHAMSSGVGAAGGPASAAEQVQRRARGDVANVAGRVDDETLAALAVAVGAGPRAQHALLSPTTSPWASQAAALLASPFLKAPPQPSAAEARAALSNAAAETSAAAAARALGASKAAAPVGTGGPSAEAVEAARALLGARNALRDAKAARDAAAMTREQVRFPADVLARDTASGGASGRSASGIADPSTAAAPRGALRPASETSAGGGSDGGSPATRYSAAVQLLGLLRDMAERDTDASGDEGVAAGRPQLSSALTSLASVAARLGAYQQAAAQREVASATGGGPASEGSQTASSSRANAAALHRMLAARGGAPSASGRFGGARGNDACNPNTRDLTTCLSTVSQDGSVVDRDAAEATARRIAAARGDRSDTATPPPPVPQPVAGGEKAPRVQVDMSAARPAHTLSPVGSTASIDGSACQTDACAQGSQWGGGSPVAAASQRGAGAGATGATTRPTRPTASPNARSDRSSTTAGEGPPPLMPVGPQSAEGMERLLGMLRAMRATRPEIGREDSDEPPMPTGGATLRRPPSAGSSEMSDGDEVDAEAATAAAVQRQAELMGDLQRLLAERDRLRALVAAATAAGADMDDDDDEDGDDGEDQPSRGAANAREQSAATQVVSRQSAEGGDGTSSPLDQQGSGAGSREQSPGAQMAALAAFRDASEASRQELERLRAQRDALLRLREEYQRAQALQEALRAQGVPSGGEGPDGEGSGAGGDVASTQRRVAADPEVGGDDSETDESAGAGAMAGLLAALVARGGGGGDDEEGGGMDAATRGMFAQLLALRAMAASAGAGDDDDDAADGAI